MKRLITLAACLLLCTAVNAQRTAAGENGLSATFAYPFKEGWGASLGWENYSLIGYVDVEASATHRWFNLEYNDAGIRLGTYHFLAAGGYMFRLLASRDRRFCFYAGGGGLLGCGLAEPSDGDWSLYNEAMGTKRSGAEAYFLLGVYPKVDVEVFFLDNTALVLSCRTPLAFHMKEYEDLQKLTGVIYVELRAGLRVNF